MNNQLTKIKAISIIVMMIMIVGFIASGCNKPYYGTTPGLYYDRHTGKAWYIDDDGGIQTNDLIELQKVTPFKIIFPSYLPPEVRDSAVMYFKEEGAEKTKKYVDIRFSYTSGHAKMVNIEERNINDNILGVNEELNPLYFKLNGTEIIRQNQKGSHNGSEVIEVDVYTYLWHKDGVSYVVDVWDYDENESQQVIESMIK
jgi:hypothetical protein